VPTPAGAVILFFGVSFVGAASGVVVFDFDRFRGDDSATCNVAVFRPDEDDVECPVPAVRGFRVFRGF